MRRSLTLKSNFLLLALLFSQQAFSAACCGGGVSAPSIIAGDDKAQVSFQYSFTSVVIDNVDPDGIWRKWENHQQVQTTRIEASHLISDRFQAGISVPMIQRKLNKETHSGLGDVSLTAGYEYLPDWDYNPYRPKGIGFLQITTPTGKSRAESEVGGIDSRGIGFWAVGIGTLLTKTIADWDAVGIFEIHHSFHKTVSNSQIDGTLKPGYGGTANLGFGYNTKNFRYGTSVAWTYEDPIDLEDNSSPFTGSIERYATGMLTVSYLASDEWLASVSYADQTLFGSPVNTSLGKTASLSLVRKWGR